MIDSQFIDKSAWGDGPWQAEPDRKEWTDVVTGLPCLAIRAPHHGSWCGYVGVAPGHPAYGLAYDGTRDDAANGDFANAKWPERKEPEGAGISMAEIEVHGGLTYAAACRGHICHVPKEGEPDNVWWFGFDTAHAWDYSPAMASRCGLSRERDEIYRDLTYVEGECASLARQLAELSA